MGQRCTKELIPPLPDIDIRKHSQYPDVWARRSDDIKGLVIAEEILDTTIKNRLEALENGHGKIR